MIEQLISRVFYARNLAHFSHWRAKGDGSYAKHKALGKFYPKIIELADSFAESYQGKFDTRIKGYTDEFHAVQEATPYIESILDFVSESREHLPQDTELQNIVDEIADLINSTLYLLSLK
jgi:DNA-binding ferritin-like protein